LKTQARKADQEADIVLIDTPPGMPETAYAAALVADLVLLPAVLRRSIYSRLKKR
jgi:cellulose biosynthesis protein BcsQ